MTLRPDWRDDLGPTQATTRIRELETEVTNLRRWLWLAIRASDDSEGPVYVVVSDYMQTVFDADTATLIRWREGDLTFLAATERGESIVGAATDASLNPRLL